MCHVALQRAYVLEQFVAEGACDEGVVDVHGANVPPSVVVVGEGLQAKLADISFVSLHRGNILLFCSEKLNFVFLSKKNWGRGNPCQHSNFFDRKKTEIFIKTFFL